MAEQDKDICRAVLDYPCEWVYKVIGTDEEQLRSAIEETIAGNPYRVTVSSSSSGKYLCLNLETTVNSEENRDAIYLTLKSHHHVKIVL